MHVAVAIVGFRNSGDIIACLGALSRATYADFEVVICENGGEHSYRSLVAALPARLPGGQTVRTICAAENLGYAGGVNVCVRASPHADAWWILNPDTVPDDTALESMVQRLSVGDCEIVGGILYGANGRIQTLGGRWRPWLARAEAIGRGRSADYAPLPGVERLIDFVSGASMLVSRRFLDVVGPMREDYFLYCEEVEWCLRGHAHGMRIALAPGARVLHRQGSSTGSAVPIRQRPRLQVYLDERNKMLVTRDCFPASLPIAAVNAFILLLVRFLGRGAWRQAFYAWCGWLNGLGNRRGVPGWAQPNISK